MSRLNESRCKAHAKQADADKRTVRNEANHIVKLRVSKSYLARLDRYVAAVIEKSVHKNGSRRTLTIDALNLVIGGEE